MGTKRRSTSQGIHEALPATRRVSICVIGEDIRPPYDEGIKGVAHQLLTHVGSPYKATGLSINRSGRHEGETTLLEVSCNRLFASRELRRLIASVEPHLIAYISPSCANIAALVRARMLKRFAPRAQVAVVALQPAGYGWLGRRLYGMLAPDLLAVQWPGDVEALKGSSHHVGFLPSGVDIDRFTPVGQRRKLALRCRYGIAPHTLAVLHVGHLNHNRNVALLAGLARHAGLQPVLVGSTSTPQDERHMEVLAQAGVRVMRDYMPHIEEIYQMCDVYLFPVIARDGAIGVPLSVLEAMACNLPVITTKFGGLPLMFREGRGLFYYNQESEVPGLIARAGRLGSPSTRQMVEPYDWGHVAQMLVQMAGLEKISA